MLNKLYIVYKIINTLDHKEYIGVHGTFNIEDDYMGSGKHLKSAINMYGEDNFKKTTLYVFDNAEEAYLKESELVDKEYVERKDTYNLKVGGEGGWDHTHFDLKRIKGIHEAIKGGRWSTWSKHDTYGFKGKTHSEETKRKIGEAKKVSKETEVYRISTFNEEEKTYGWKARLAKKWGISPQKVAPWLKHRDLI